MENRSENGIGAMVGVVRNVVSEVQEIRERAVENIVCKIDSGLMSRGDACSPELGLYTRLVAWLGNDSWRRPPSFWKLLNMCVDNDGEKTAEVASLFRTKTIPTAPAAAATADDDDPNLKEILDAVERVDRDTSTSGGSSLSFESFRRVAESSALPRHLLRHQDSAADSLSSSKPLTPVTRTYFKRVHFTESAENSRKEDTSIKFPWVELNRHDSNVLAEVLKNLDDDPTSSLDILRYKTLADFPAEVFLQRPDIFHTLLEIYTFNPDPEVQEMACECICQLAKRLRIRHEFDEETGGERRRSKGATSKTVREANPGERQIDLHDFCLLALSGAATVMRSGGQDNLGLFRSTGELLSSSAEVAVAVDSDLVWQRASSYVQDILRDVIGDLKHASTYHKTVSSKSPVECRRRAFIVIANAIVECADLFAGAGQDFHALVSAFCQDETIFMSHPKIYEKLLDYSGDEFRARHGQVKVMMGSLESAVAFLRGSSNSEECAREAALFHTLHESRIMPGAVLRLLKSSRSEGISEIAIFLLQSSDIQLQTAAYLQLHRVAKESLGIARAVDPGSGAAENVVFYLSNRSLFEEVTGGGLFHGSANIRSACEEILVYAMKSEQFVQKSQWAGLRDAFVKRFPVIECCAARDASICGDNLLRAVARPGGKFGASNITRIQVNTRLLFSKRSSTRNEALVNLKFLIPHEEGGLVRDADRSIAHVFVHLRPGILSAPVAELSSGCSPAVSAVSLAAVVEALKGGWSTEDDLKLALSQLQLTVQDPRQRDAFVADCGGVALLAKVLKSTLERGVEPTGVLCRLISAVKTVVCLSGVARAQIAADVNASSLFLALLSCVFIEFDDPMCKSDLAVIMFLVLYKDFLEVTAAGKVHVNRAIAEHTNAPFECLHTSELITCQLSPYNVEEEHLPMFKTAWNIAWFGGVGEVVDGVQDPSSADFSERLQLSSLDRSVLRHSFMASAHGADMLSKSRCHGEVRAALDYLRTVPRQLLRVEGLEDILKRFLLLIPKAGDDLQLFFEIAGFTAWACCPRGGETSPPRWLEAAMGKFRLFQAFDGCTDWKLRDSHAISSLHAVLPWKEMDEIPPTLLKWSDTKEAFLALETLTAILESEFVVAERELADFIEKVETRLISHPLSFDNSAEGLKMFRFLDVISRKGVSKTAYVSIQHLASMCQRAETSAIKASALNVVSLLARKIAGGEGEVSVDLCNTLWSIGLRTFMRPQEPMIVRNQAATLIMALLPTSPRPNSCMWPTVHERVTGLTLTGDAALLLLLKQTSFEEFALGALDRELRGKVVLTAAEIEARARTLDLIATFLPLDSTCVDVRAVLSKLLDTAVDFSDDDVDVPRSRPLLLARSLRSELETIHLLIGISGAGDVVAAHISSIAVLTSSVLFLMGEGDRKNEANLHLFHSLSRILFMAYSNFLDGFKRAQVMNKYIVPVVKNTLKIVEEGCAFALRLSVTRMLGSIFSAVHEQKQILGSSQAAVRLNAERNGQPSVTQRLCQELLSKISSLESRHGSASTAASSVHFRTLTAMFAVSFVAQDCALQSDLLPLLSRQLDALAERAEPSHGAGARTVPKMTTRDDELCAISEVLSLLNNLCYKNVTAKMHVARKTALLSQLHHLHPIIAADADSLEKYLHFLTTLCVDCDPARRCLVSAQKAGISREMKRTCSVIAFLVELLRHDDMAPAPLYRLLTVAVGNAECRKYVARSEVFLERCREVVVVGGSGAKTAKARSPPADGLEVLALDLLLGMTAHKDAQILLGQGPLLESMVEYAAGKCHTVTTRQLSLAVLRNLCFASVNRYKLLQSKEFLRLVADILEGGSGAAVRTIVFVMIWMLAANNSRAKQILKRSGVSEAFFRTAGSVSKSTDISRTLSKIL